ncbi:uncharacterized protein LOC107434348 [Ziziphus jujuba]|uniref:Uncharacterized protein LOC107434348 n=2 Tax=Ziziphus jujuba TaxID=326968 RepID=A0A6P4AVG1_ZIZJJ|nr:uncharacterized protein LOC107434348 [Ziziphus jujuba]KAH7546995.1 hypothetical protein FEM48_Zijuj01G0260100 [Ziziphus jujuba var. spinosa]
MTKSSFYYKLQPEPHQQEGRKKKTYSCSPSSTFYFFLSSSSSSCGIESMALTCYFSPHVTVEKSCLIVKPFRKVLRLKNSQFSVKKTSSAIKIRSSFREKVFEDRSEGIICYRDDSGEIVCEGIDEGPRYHQQFPRTSSSSHSRDAEILDILQQRWLNFFNGTELNPADKSVAVQKDINCNGFNSLR